MSLSDQQVAEIGALVETTMASANEIAEKLNLTAVEVSEGYAVFLRREYGFGLSGEHDVTVPMRWWPMSARAK